VDGSWLRYGSLGNSENDRTDMGIPTRLPAAVRELKHTRLNDLEK